MSHCAKFLSLDYKLVVLGESEQLCRTVKIAPYAKLSSLVRVGAVVEFASALLGYTQGAKRHLSITFVKGYVRAVYLYSDTEPCRLGKESVHFSVGNELQSLEVLLALGSDASCTGVGESDLAKRQISRKKHIESLYPELSKSLRISVVALVDSEALHMQMRSRYNNKIELVEALGGYTYHTVFVHIRLTAEEEFHLVISRQRQCAFKVGKFVIFLIPPARAVNRFVPEVVGQGYLLKSVLLGLAQNILRRLLGVRRALRNH